MEKLAFILGALPVSDAPGMSSPPALSKILRMQPRHEMLDVNNAPNSNREGRTPQYAGSN
jgi:hypothetical protein